MSVIINGVVLASSPPVVPTLLYTCTIGGLYAAVQTLGYGQKAYFDGNGNFTIDGVPATEVQLAALVPAVIAAGG